MLLGSITLSGCRESGTPAEPPSESRGIRATPDGEGVMLTWNSDSECDGYEIRRPFRDGTLICYTNTYVDSYPTATGTYVIYAIYGAQRIPIDSFSTAPYESESDGYVYVWGSNEGPSGFGWNTTTGLGASYECIDDHREVIDFFLREIEFPLYFVSANEAPFSGSKTTGIRIMYHSDFFAAPASNYDISAIAGVDFYYAFRLEGNYYAKVFDLVEGCHTIIGFKYQFQTIQGLRIF